MTNRSPPRNFQPSDIEPKIANSLNPIQFAIECKLTSIEAMHSPEVG